MNKNFPPQADPPLAEKFKIKNSDTYKKISGSPWETFNIGKEISGLLKGGEIVFLSGILGAGKTVLVKGIAEGLGVKSKITSPTFNIFRVYHVARERRDKFYHFDCYRLKKYADLVNLGWEEIIAEKDSIIALEWPECIIDKNITRWPGKKVIFIKISIEGKGRIINTKIWNIKLET